MNLITHVIDMLYEREIIKKSLAELFEPNIIYVVGCEMFGKFPRDFETVLANSTNYNMIFVLVASNIDFNVFMIHKACNYLFVNGIMKHISQNSKSLLQGNPRPQLL